MGMGNIISLLLEYAPKAIGFVGDMLSTGTPGTSGVTGTSAVEAAQNISDDRDYRDEAQSIMRDAKADLLSTHNENEVSDNRLKTKYGMNDNEIKNFISFLQYKNPGQGNVNIGYTESNPRITDEALEQSVKEFRDVRDDVVDVGRKRNVSSQNRDQTGRFSKPNAKIGPDPNPQVQEATAKPVTPPSPEVEDTGNDGYGLYDDDSSAGIPYGMINEDLDRALKHKLIGSLVASALSFDAGGFGDQSQFGQGLKPVGSAIQGLTNLTYAEKKGEIARTAEERMMLELKEELDKIDADPEMTAPQKAFYKDRAKDRMHDKVRRMQYTMRLDAPVGQGESKISDEKMKVVKPCARTALKLMRSGLELSDEDYKVFRDIDPEEMAVAINEAGPPYKGYELEFLNDFTAGREGGDYVKPIQYADIWAPEVLQGYAMWIKNAHYNYKPEAQALDPDIDPNQEHIGPMAQEIEKVIPAAVEEVQGVKTVDTGRLALANAGAIADLARQNIMQGKAIEKLTSVLKGVA